MLFNQLNLDTDLINELDGELYDLENRYVDLQNNYLDVVNEKNNLLEYQQKHYQLFGEFRDYFNDND